LARAAAASVSPVSRNDPRRSRAGSSRHSEADGVARELQKRRERFYMIGEIKQGRRGVGFFG